MQSPSPNYAAASSSSSSSPNSPSHSSITLHSLVASSTDSTSSFQSSFPSSSSSSSPSRCFGLNLLVKAIHQVTGGSVVGVPYIQRRIVTRRRRPIQFNNLIITAAALLPKSGSKLKSKSKSKSKPKAKRQRRVNTTMPSKYKDSVLQPLTPKRRSERSSTIKIIGE